jgi:hypothetical protein
MPAGPTACEAPGERVAVTRRQRQDRRGYRVLLEVVRWHACASEESNTIIRNTRARLAGTTDSCSRCFRDAYRE